MVQGLTNKVLRVNLTNRRISVDEPDDLFYRRYLGGAGFVAYYLLKEMKPGALPLSPDNILIFALGPMTGTPMPGGSRNCIGAKSPLSGGMAKSEVGGFFGYELKRAGFDTLIVEGRASSPAYLWIHDGEVEIRDGRHLWGKTVLETQDAIEAELGERFVRTATIGPAGEKKAAMLFAVILLAVFSGISVARADFWHWPETLIMLYPDIYTVRNTASNWILHLPPYEFNYNQVTVYVDDEYYGYDTSQCNCIHTWATVYADNNPGLQEYYASGLHYWEDIGFEYSDATANL